MGDLHLWECAADNVRLMSGIQLKPRTNFLLKMGKCSTARDAPTEPVGPATTVAVASTSADQGEIAGSARELLARIQHTYREVCPQTTISAPAQLTPHPRTARPTLLHE